VPSTNVLRLLLSIFALSSAILHIRAEYRGPRQQIYLFKPLTTSLILLLALLTSPSDTQFYKFAIIAGLVFSLAGDIFLMLPTDRFVSGLVSFLIAHLAYIIAFASATGFYFSIWALLPFLLFGVFIFTVLVSGLGDKKIPVAVYIVVIVVMTWQALGLWLYTDQTRALLAFLGALLFLISDSVLAINRFKQPFKSARLVNLSTYYAAQWLIALSV